MYQGIVLAGITLAPWAAALLSAVAGRLGWSGTAVARLATATVGAGFLATVAVTPSVLLAGNVRLGSEASSVQLDALALILSLLVLGLSALIQAFAIRYLRGDPHQVWFVVTANLLTASTVLLVCAGSVALFAAAWVGAGVSLLLLLATYRRLDQARTGIRRTAIRFLIADVPFVVAVTILLVSAGGDVPLSRLGQVTAALPVPVQLTIAAALVAAALARSSQIPFQGWLPFTLAAPTPVSALMHAGVVNAGAILLIRFSPAIASHPGVPVAVFLVGAATLVYASAVRLTRPDVKGRLVFSTMAQMGFMIMACGLGAYAAAIFHLVAHSLFKSSLFLGAGMRVRQHAIERDLPARQSLSPWAAAAAVGVAVLVSAAALVLAKAAFSPTVSAASAGLLLFVALTAGLALGAALTSDFAPRTLAAGTLGMVTLIFGYVALLKVFTAALQPVAAPAAPAWLLVLPGLGLLIVQLLSRNPRRFSGLADLVYTRSAATTRRPPASIAGVRS